MSPPASDNEGWPDFASLDASEGIRGMQFRRPSRSVLALLAFGLMAETAMALPHWKPRPAGPTTAYAPRMRHFIVIDPVPAAPEALVPTPILPASAMPPAAMPPAATPAPLPALANQVRPPRAGAPASPPNAGAEMPAAGAEMPAAGAAPVPVRRKGERVKKALSPAQTQTIFWQQRVEPVPAYPWGWFGARRHTSHTGHRRFYGGEFDSELLRGD
jgi:hypothetical protein